VALKSQNFKIYSPVALSVEQGNKEWRYNMKIEDVLNVKTYTPKEIAKHHGVDLDFIKKELSVGIAVEKSPIVSKSVIGDSLIISVIRIKIPLVLLIILIRILTCNLFINTL
jgi:hypothetical protein